jgi:uncharacterized protein (TIGR03545 family)
MRWKFVVPALLLFGAIIAFNLLFLDGIIKRIIISTGQATFGAKVEIDALKTRFSDLSIDIRGLRVADRNDAWRNQFEAGDIRFALKPLPLLSKKFIIEDMAVEGVRWGTKRTTSGALPRHTAARIAKANEKQDKNSLTAKLSGKIQEKGKAAVNALPGIESIRSAEANLKNLSVEKAVKIADLRSISEMDTARKDVQKKYGDYQTRLANLKVDEKANNAVAAVNDAVNLRVNGIQDIEPARKKIDNLNRSREELQRTLSDMQNLRDQVNADLGNQQAVVGKINDLKNGDYQNIAAKLKIPSLSFGNVSRFVFGPVWIDRVDTVVYYMHLARKYMPKKEKKNDVVIRPRMKGVDVSFPRENVPPDFLIQRMTLSGTTGGPGKEGEALDFQGVVTDITSDPVLLGRPLRFTINGAKAGRKLDIRGVLDHTGDVATDSLAIAFNGLTAGDLKIPQSDYLPSFENGVGNVVSQFVLKGDNLDCSVGMTLGGLSFNANKPGQNEEAGNILASLWQGVSSIDVKARMYGAPDALQMTVTSNIDSLLSGRLQNLYGAQVAELQNRVKAEVDRLTADKQKELLAEYASRHDALTKEFDGKQKELQDRIDAAKAQVTQKENEIKNQAGNELKNKATEQLKNLFGR